MKSASSSNNSDVLYMIHTIQRLTWRSECSCHCMPCVFVYASVDFSIHECAYLPGLLAMIKCSICSYQCENWYVSKLETWLSHLFLMGKCLLELAQVPSCVAPELHLFGCSPPFGVTQAWNSFIVHGMTLIKRTNKFKNTALKQYAMCTSFTFCKCVVRSNIGQANVWIILS